MVALKYYSNKKVFWLPLCLGKADSVHETLKFIKII